MAAILDVATANWLSELEMDDYNIIHQCHMNSINLAAQDHTVGATALQQSFASFQEKPAKRLKNNSSISFPSSPSSRLLSFESFASPAASDILTSELKTNEKAAYSNGLPYEMNHHRQGIKRVGSINRSPSNAQDHIIAERKRREKLAQRFIALSSIVPGLKKMDKASVIGDAIQYIKELRGRVEELEEQTKIRTLESVVLVRKTKVALDDKDRDQDAGSASKSSLPEIEAKASGREILIRIHCMNQNGCVVKILSEVENMGLSIVTNSVLSFANTTLDVTLITRMKDGFKLSLKDVVKELRSALSNFM